MKRLFLVTGVLFACSTVAIAAPQCPSEIETQQQLTGAVPGWHDLRAKTPHRLNQITFFDGHPDEQASLVPDTTKSVKGPEISTWQFASKAGRRLWIACGYAGTTISLIQELPEALRTCSVMYDPRARLAGQPRISNLDCR